MHAAYPTSRRGFIRTLGTGLALATVGRAVASAALSPKISGEPRALVLIRLAGGNDGFNTLVPRHDDNYHRLRPSLALHDADVISLDEKFALSRAARELLPLFNEGKLAILPDVGFPVSVDSHYRACEMWHTASTAELVPSSSWMARSLATFEDNEGVITFPRVNRSDSNLAAQLHEIAQQLVRTHRPVIYSLTLSGFDTHYEQATHHPRLLQTLASALTNFQSQISRNGASSRVTTVVFSEFGRTLAENHQGGTDHGNSAPVFLLGDALRGGVHGRSTDFRQLIASLSHDWLGVSRAVAIAESSFHSLPLFPSQRT